MGFDTAYEVITEEHDETRWAFGTGFEDPLAGVDTTLPIGVDGTDLATYCLMLGDDALVCSQRLQQWIGRAPELEEETALANIGLDLLGQTRLLYSRAGRADGSGRSEDELAYLRDEHEFRNVRLVEGIDADFASLMVRLAIFSMWRLTVFDRLCTSTDPVLKAVAAKGAKELTYHRQYTAEWVVSLGDGTEESHQRTQAGMEALAPLVPELFVATALERRLAATGVGVDPAEVESDVRTALEAVWSEATVTWPEVAPLAGVSNRHGRDGVHTEAMGFLLAELQSVARAHPGATW